jgi:hypothetical protein
MAAQRRNPKNDQKPREDERGDILKDVVYKKQSRAGWAGMGLALGLSMAAFAFVFTPYVTDMIDRAVPRLRLRGSLQDQAQLVVGIVLWLLLITLCGVIVAAFAPKKMLNVKETDLTKERSAMVVQRRFERNRQRKINRQMREYRENSRKK